MANGLQTSCANTELAAHSVGIGNVAGAESTMAVASDPCEAEHGCLVGTLLRMESAKQSIALAYRDGRVLKGTYASVCEAALLRSPGGLVEVRGSICYDAAGEPAAIGEVNAVAEVDESPVVLEEVVYRNRRYAATTPLRFDVAFNRDDLFYEASGAFDILLSADSREGLVDALQGELRLLLAEYAEGNPERMTSGAKNLREQVRRRFGF